MLVLLWFCFLFLLQKCVSLLQKCIKSVHELRQFGLDIVLDI